MTPQTPARLSSLRAGRVRARRAGPVRACAVSAVAVLAVVTALAGLGVSRLRAAAPSVDDAFGQYWSATSPAEAAQAARAIVESGVSFDQALARLRQGKTYAADAAKGVVRLTRRAGTTDFAYMLDVPASYDPKKPIAVRMQLHGGVGRPEATQRGNGIGALAGAEQIYIMPTAWADAEWWTNAQFDNLRAILDSVKRRYNIDENRVALSGVSDGGTATYYMAMRDTTPFSAFLPLNGAVIVLRNSTMQVDGELFLHNFVNKPFFIVNGGRDPLYPTGLVEPYIEQMVKGGVTVKYLPQPEAVHNTAWWPEVKDTYEAFVREHPRQPFPDRLTWETDLSAGTERAHWLVVDTLARRSADAAPLPDINDVVTGSEPNFGVRAVDTRIQGVTAGSNAASFGLQPGDVVTKIGPRSIPSGVDVIDLLSIVDPGTPLTLTVNRDGQPRELTGVYQPVSTPRVSPTFVHKRPSGRVDVSRRGNTFTATTRGVGAFTLLLSPSMVDFAAPIRVVVDGQTRFDGRVSPSIETLVKWAARDNDRTMLFGAELRVTLAP